MLKECFDKYALSDIEKVSGKDMREGRKALMSMTGEGAPSKKRRVRPLVIAAAGLAAASALTVSVGAANDWNFEKAISVFYSISADDKEQMEDAAKKLDGMMYQAKDCVTTSTFQNYDVTMGDYIFNGKSVMYPIYIKAKDGTPFEKFTETYGYDPINEVFQVEGNWPSGGTRGWDVLEDGSLCYYYNQHLRKETEITEPTKATITIEGLRLCGITMEDRIRLAVPESELIYDEDLNWWYIINENGERENLCGYQDNKNEKRYSLFVKESDFYKELDSGVFTAEIILNPVGETKHFTLSKGKNTADINMSAFYVEVALKDGKTADGRDTTEWSALMYDAMFIYDTDGNVMLCPDDYDEGSLAGGGSGEPSSFTEGFPKIIDVEKIGAIRIGDYTFGDVPPIDYEKYPYIRDYYGIEE